MELREVRPDDAASVAAMAAMLADVDRADAPWWPVRSAYRLEMEMRHGWDGEVGRHFLAYDAASGPEPVGYGCLDTSEWDNTALGWLGVKVPPALRRRGHGRAILAALTKTSLDSGRPLLGMHGWDAPATHAFATAHGFTHRATEALRLLPVQGPGALSPAALAGLADEAAALALDYDLVKVTGRAPECLLPALADLTGAINDAPTDDLEYEPEVYPVARIRSYENAVAESGHRMYRLVAVHRESGDLVGHTIVAVETDEPVRGWQHDTSVIGDHRGHRLGLLLKTRMLQWLRTAEPALVEVRTYNATSNDPMIAVNDRLGCVVLGHEVQFQRRVADV